MRKVIIAGNWKMNNDVEDSISLAKELKENYSNKNNVEVIVCPTYTNLYPVNEILKNSEIKIGGQNIYPKLSGAYTGEISADMLKSVGCTYVIIGHSERREYFKEANNFLNKKIKTSLDNGLKPIYCIGETLEERESEKTFNVLEKQLKEGLANFSNDELSKIVIAYEPVWAIGTGKTASPAQAQEVHAFIRKLLTELSSDAVSSEISILYGGSVKPDNATELMSCSDIDGALVGGASLKADSFEKIINY